MDRPLHTMGASATDAQLPSQPSGPRTPSAGDALGARADTVVIGAGLGGLLAATTAARAAPHARVVLVDPHPAGGRARCDVRDGFTFNRGPRALYVCGPADDALRAAGVDTGRGGPPDLGGALAIAGGRLHRFPSGPIATARTSLFTTREKAAAGRALAAMWRADASTTDARSLASWLDARAVSGVVREFVQALVRVATYANAPGTFAAGPALANARLGIRPGVRYLDGGWQSLVDQLFTVAQDSGVEVIKQRARRIVDADGTTTVHFEHGALRARTVIIAVGGPDAAAALLGERPRSWGSLAPPVTAACLELGVRGMPEHRFALGIDEPEYASVHAPPADLAPEGHAVVHLMRYQRDGDHQPAAQQHERLRELARSLGVGAEQVVTERFLARMVVASSLPTAPGGLAHRPSVSIPERPNVLLAGDWVGPVGLLLDAVAASAVAAGKLAGKRSGTMVPA